MAVDDSSREFWWHYVDGVSRCLCVWYGMVNIDLYSAIITKSLMRYARSHVSKVQDQTLLRGFLYMLSVAVARSSFDVSAIRYVLPVLWITSRFMVRGIHHSVLSYACTLLWDWHLTVMSAIVDCLVTFYGNCIARLYCTVSCSCSQPNCSASIYALVKCTFLLDPP